jgi:Trk-type K+ transport system membrane component
LNGIDWAAFELLNIGNQNIGKYPIIDGLFQAFAVRSGGFYVVSISGLRIGLLWLYVVMMYISVYPVVITMRNTNVYEERSLGLYAEDLEDAPSDGATSNFTFIRQQLRAQLAHDAWVLAVALIIISIIETSKFEKDPINFSPLHFLFEIVSGYGCVGISMGIPWENFSFCGTWKKSSKLIMCVVMLRGRHRGLPVAIDPAVLLP